MTQNGSRKAVVLLSGGMDSCVCAALAARDFHAAAMHFDYGQRTERRERIAFAGICDQLGIRERMVVKSDLFRRIGGSALTDQAIAVPEAKSDLGAGGEKSDDVPVTYVPFRNAHFLSAAVSWAEVLGAGRIYIGAVEQDSSGYPDCRPAYYQAFQEVIRTGTKAGDIRIETPLIAMRKAEIVQLGNQLGAPLDLTWSCYSEEELACGICESCLLRLRAFESAGVKDPIPYRKSEFQKI